MSLLHLLWKKMSKFYAVKRGRKTGVYTNWKSCKEQIVDFEDALYKTFPTRRAANQYLNSRPKRMYKPKPIIYCSGGSSDLTNGSACASVTDQNGRDLLGGYNGKDLDDFQRVKVLSFGFERTVIVSDFMDAAIQENSGAELIAMYSALRIALQNPLYKTIRTDSWRMTDHWSKQFNAKRTPRMDPRKAELITTVIDLREQFEERGGVVEKVLATSNVANLNLYK
jgi:hypothetical protein